MFGTVIKGALVEPPSVEPLSASPRRASTKCLLIDSVATLATAAARAHDAGRIVLVTTNSLKWALTGLNAIALLRAQGFDGVLHITSSQRECRLVSRQTAVPVRHCAWTAHHFLRNRLWTLAELARLRYQVLMVDSDVCFTDNPFTWLQRQNRALILHASDFNSFNLGTVYADGRTASPDLGLLSSAATRVEEIHRAFVAIRESGVYVAGNVAWDQAVFADAFEEWVTGRPCILRTCREPGAIKQCFWRCCEEGILDGATNESSADHALSARTKADSAALDRSRGILAIEFAKCSSPAGIYHHATCASRIPTAKPYSYWPRWSIQWLGGNCWHSSLTMLAERWGVKELWGDVNVRNDAAPEPDDSAELVD